MIKAEDVYRIGIINKPHGVHGELLLTFDDDIFDAARSLYRAFTVPKGQGIRLLGVSASGFDGGAEIDLFRDEERDEKKERLYGAIDNLKKRFGESIVSKAALARSPSSRGETEEE